jgi:hypothetical protein
MHACMRASAVVFGFALSACSVHVRSRAVPVVPASEPELSVQREIALPIGVVDDSDAVVRVVAPGVSCSGTLVAEDLVLTAHHCVSARTAEGGFAERDVSPSAVMIEVGGAHFAWGQLSVRHIVTPPCGHAAGQGDIAVLVLERRIAGIPTLAPRLEGAPVPGEPLEPMGFGRCALSDDGIRRHQRQGGVLKELHRTRFRMVASVCPGDSGGPVLSGATGEVVGVVSSAAMDAYEGTAELAELTRLDAWREVFSYARQLADGVERAELPPLAACRP